MAKSEKRNKSIARCTYCGSDKTKKRFLRIPNVFGCGPVLYGGLVLMGAVLTLLHGLVSAKPISSEGPHDWLVEVIVGLIMALAMIAGLIAKTHKCFACGRGFNWPPSLRNLKITCPNCGARLRGADSDMIGDTAVCVECKFEFEIADEQNLHQ